MQNPKVRRWSGTWNDYTEDQVTEYLKIHGESMRYFIGGKEKCPTTGRPHLQIYMELYKQIRLSTLKTWNSVIHWEPSKKGKDANVNYCKKDGDFIEINRESNSDTTSKSFMNLQTELATQESLNFSRKMPAMQHIAGTELWNSWCKDFMNGTVTTPDVIYITGPTGSGKTWKAYEIALGTYGPEETSIVEPCNSFFNALNPRAKCWILPEFRPATLEASVFLQMLDIYPFVANIKGTHALVRPECVIIASIKPPDEIYKEEINRQFQRRITQLIDLTLNPWSRALRQEAQESIPLDQALNGFKMSHLLAQKRSREEDGNELLE